MAPLYYIVIQKNNKALRLALKVGKKKANFRKNLSYCNEIPGYRIYKYNKKREMGCMKKQHNLLQSMLFSLD